MCGHYSMYAYLIEKHLGFSQNVLEFGEFQEVPLQGLRVLVDFTKFVFKFFKSCLQGEHKIYRLLTEVDFYI